MNCFVLHFAVPDKNSFNNSISDHQVGVTSLLRARSVSFANSLFLHEGWMLAKKVTQDWLFGTTNTIASDCYLLKLKGKSSSEEIFLFWNEIQKNIQKQLLYMNGPANHKYFSKPSTQNSSEAPLFFLYVCTTNDIKPSFDAM